MDSYNLSYTLGFEQQKRLSDLARRCREVKYPVASNGVFDPRGIRQLSVQARPLGSLLAGINGWGAQELLQHAATANYKADIDLKVDFWEDEVDQLENKFCRQHTTGKDLFNDLWNECISLRLLALTKGTPLADLDYQDMFQCLPAEKRQEFMDKRNYFLERSGFSL